MRDWAQARSDVPRFRALAVEVIPLLLQGSHYGMSTELLLELCSNGGRERESESRGRKSPQSPPLERGSLGHLIKTVPRGHGGHRPNYTVDMTDGVLSVL
jgi:hypothetical protein